MNLNLKVVLQWFALLLGLGSVKGRHISSEIVEKLLGQFYIIEGIWIKEALYIAELGVLQIVAKVPPAHYLPDAPHVTKEQYVRVQTQASVLIALLSENVPTDIRSMSAREFSDNLYYREERTRWRRLVPRCNIS